LLESQSLLVIRLRRAEMLRRVEARAFQAAREAVVGHLDVDVLVPVVAADAADALLDAV
jgi:hypothetical protein